MRLGRGKIGFKKYQLRVIVSLGEKVKTELWHWRGRNTFKEYLGGDSVRFNDAGDVQM